MAKKKVNYARKLAIRARMQRTGEAWTGAARNHDAERRAEALAPTPEAMRRIPKQIAEYNRCSHGGCAARMTRVAGGFGYCGDDSHVPTELRSTLGAARTTQQALAETAAIDTSVAALVKR
jgi:hypothetical protein